MLSQNDLNQSNWFDVLLKSSQEVWGDTLLVCEYKSGQKIYDTGAPCDAMYVLLEGVVKIGVRLDQTKEIIKHLIYSIEFFGESIYTEHLSRKDFAIAHEKCKVMIIPQQIFLKVLNSNAEFRKTIVITLVKRIKFLEERINAINNKPVLGRVVNYIRQQTENRSIKIGIEELLILNGMAHKDIAILTDTSRQTVSKVIAKLKKHNLIQFDSRRPERMLVRNMDALLAMC